MEVGIKLTFKTATAGLSVANQNQLGQWPMVQPKLHTHDFGNLIILNSLQIFINRNCILAYLYTGYKDGYSRCRQCA